MADVAVVRSRGRRDRVEWRVSAALGFAFLVAAAGLHPVFDRQTWWFVVAIVVLLVLGSAAVTRAAIIRRDARSGGAPISPGGARWRTAAPTVAAVAAWVSVITALFGAGSGWLLVLPTVGTAGRFADLVREAGASIYRQSIPASADESIVFVLAAGIGLLVVAADLLAITAAVPAVAGVLLLGVLAIPVFVARGLADPLVFAAAAAAFLLVLIAGRPRQQRGLSAAIGATAIVSALILPIALPAVSSPTASAGPGVSTGVNPVLTLGADLRRATERDVLSYSTGSGTAHYLRLVTLEDFTGATWAPTRQAIDPDNDIAQFPSPPGLASDVPSVRETTTIEVGNLTSPWLPVPYPATSIDGAEGNWYWEPGGLSVSSPSDTTRGQSYTVSSVVLEPTPQQLLAAGANVPAEFAPFLALPADLPEVISTTATAVASESPSNYEKALALQQYFRSGVFEYSEDSPVSGGYDGTGLSVLERFLEVRAGYCVHFASAMAVMARSLGIPARVVVGFLPGVPLTSGGTQRYGVTTHDLHSWPELYFDGIGWVQFEPTPGRGALAAYADVESAGVPAPAAPQDGAAGVTPSEAPTPSASASAGRPVEDVGASPQVTTGGSQWARGAAIVAGVALLSLLPAFVRRLQRRTLMRRLARGGSTAVDAWREVMATAVDFRVPVAATQTPRETARALARNSPSLDRLLGAAEREGYGDAAVDSSDLPRDLEAVRRSLREGASTRGRLAAVFYPASLWRAIRHPTAWREP